MISATKKDILEALRTEPLGFGGWTCLYEPGKCMHCAVGALLSRLTGYVSGSTALRLTDYAASGVPREGNWLSALSCEWERMGGSERGNAYPLVYRKATEEERERIISWATKHIPGDYEVEIPV